MEKTPATKSYSNKEIVDYYDRTEVHYRRAWDLQHSLAMHYGYWNADTKNFRESLHQLNVELAAYAGIQQGDRVLDAGCGVGGSSIFLAKEFNCSATGITLSKKQVESADRNAAENEVADLAKFQVADFTKLPFESNTFDAVWAVESVVHTPQKVDFFKEAFRVLKKGGRLVIGEYLKTEKTISKKEQQMLWNWLNAWAIHGLNTESEYQQFSNQAGFASLECQDITAHIRKSSWRMYYGSFFLKALSAGYRLYNPGVSYFADNHHHGLYYQYPALRRKLWTYQFLRATKS